MLTGRYGAFLPALTLSVTLAGFAQAVSHEIPKIPSYKDFGSDVQMAFHLPEDWLVPPYDSKDWKFEENVGYETSYQLDRNMGSDKVGS